MSALVAPALAAAAVLLAAARLRPPIRLPAVPAPPAAGTAAGLPGHRSPPPDRPAPWPEPASVRRRLGPLAATAAGVALLFLAGPLSLLATAGLLGLRQAIGRRRRARRYSDALVTAVAETSELVVAAVHAGLTPHAALTRLTPMLPAPLGGALAEVLQRVAHGERLADALDGLPASLGEPARPLARALASADRHGTALAPALDLLAAEARAERRRRAEEAARRVPVRLSFPLVACFLPALALCTVVPLLAGTLSTLQL